MSTIKVANISHPSATSPAIKLAADGTAGIAALNVNTESGTTYTFTADDAGKLVAASNASAKTFTIPPQSSVAWAAGTVLNVVNYGAGALTVDGGSGVTVTNTATTLAQFQSAAAIRTAEDAWTLVPFAGGGVGDADFSNTATGTYTSGSDSYKYVRFTGSGTLTITVEGVADILAVGPGQTTSGNGNGGVVAYSSITIPVGSYSVAIGASETSQGAGNSTPTRLGNVIGAGRGIGASNLGNGGFNPSSNGVVIDITGTSREYGAGGGRKASLPSAEDRYGIGGDPAISNRAGSGVVIIRVKV